MPRKDITIDDISEAINPNNLTIKILCEAAENPVLFFEGHEAKVQFGREAYEIANGLIWDAMHDIVKHLNAEETKKKAA